MAYNQIIKSLLDYLGIDKKYLISRDLRLCDIVWNIDEAEEFLGLVEMSNLELVMFYLFICPKITYDKHFNTFEDRLWLYSPDKVNFNSCSAWRDDMNGG